MNKENFNATERADPAVSGDQANPDADHHGNVWEFFMGSNPMVADPANGFEQSVAGTNLVFSFRVGPDINPAWYQVKDSRNLVNWSPLAPDLLVVSPHPLLPGMLQGVVTYPIQPGGSGFLRVEFNPYQP